MGNEFAYKWRNLPGNDSSQITEADLHGGRNADLVMPGDVVAHPHQTDGLRDVASADDQEESKVADADVDSMHVEQDDVADGGHQTPGDDEAVAVLQFVAEQSDAQGADGGKDEDGDRHDLRADRRPAQLFQNRRREEGAAVAGRHNAQVHGDTKKVEVSWIVGHSESSWMYLR